MCDVSFVEIVRLKQRLIDSRRRMPQIEYRSTNDAGVNRTPVGSSGFDGSAAAEVAAATAAAAISAAGGWRRLLRQRLQHVTAASSVCSIQYRGQSVLLMRPSTSETVRCRRHRRLRFNIDLRH